MTEKKHWRENLRPFCSTEGHHNIPASYKVERDGTVTYVCGLCARGNWHKATVTKLKLRKNKSEASDTL